MHAESIQHAVCPRCEATVDIQAPRCPRCGSRLDAPGELSPRQIESADGRNPKWMDKPWSLILGLLVGCPITLPALYRTKVYTWRGKIVLGILIAAWMALLIAAIVWNVRNLMRLYQSIR